MKLAILKRISESNTIATDLYKKKQLLLIIVLTIIYLAFVVNTSLPFEQDQGSKGARIVYMVKSDNLFRPGSGTSLYRENLFSLYYILSALMYKVVGGNIFAVMNLSSVLLGIIFFIFLSILLNRTLHTDHLLNWIVFISMPIITTTFIYGNEVAFSITFFVISLVFLSLYQSKLGRFLSALFLSASPFCRPDIILLLPFSIGWYIWIKDYSYSNKRMWAEVVELLTFVLFLSFLYWFTFIRKLEFAPLSFEYHTNIKLLLAYLVYPFNLTVFFIGSLGLLFLLIKKEKFLWVLACLALPFLFYFNNLSSPKYIISLAFLFGIPTVLVMSRAKIGVKIILVVMICIWYITSVTPYGVKNFRAGASIFIPTADGPIPSGSYFWFYQYVRNGFYSAKYEGEIKSARNLIEYIADNRNSNILIVGRFNGHFLFSELAVSPFYKEMSEWEKKWYVDSFPEQENVRYLMPQRAYLSLNNMSDEMKDHFIRFLVEGRVLPINTTFEKESVFPSVIEIGNSVPPNTNSDLANRILFANQYYKGEGIVNTSFAPEYYSPTYWVKNNSLPSINAAPIYQDHEWVCYNQDVRDAQIWVTEIPIVYLNERDPNE